MVEEPVIKFQKRTEKVEITESRRAPQVAVASNVRWIAVPVEDTDPVNRDAEN